jgi:hypothetical protein
LQLFAGWWLVASLFELPPKVFSTLDELFYWFKSTHGQPESPTYLLRDYNNIFYNKGETIKSFNLCFSKLYNQIPKVIRAHNQDDIMLYYNTLTSSYHYRLEENNAYFLGSALQTYLEYEEHLTRTSLPLEDQIKHTDMLIVLLF